MNVMKSSLGDCNTQTWGIQPGGIGEILKEENVLPHLNLYIPQQTVETSSQRLGLDFVVVFRKLSVSYILKT